MKERTEDTTVACPIVYGSLANVITGRRLDDSTATHKWTLFGILIKVNHIVFRIFKCCIDSSWTKWRGFKHFC